MTFGLMFRPGAFPWPHMVTCMKVAEAVGFDTIWFGDSHLIWHEVGPYLTAAALSTVRMRVGPLVANPVTRHPTVVASTMATLAELFDGRAVLGIGRGDSAVRTLGLQPMKVGDFRESLRLVRALCRGEAARLGETTVRFAWLRRTIPVLVAAYGPRVLELAGAEADGLILQVASPSVTEWALRHARNGAQEAGRSLDGFEVVAAAPTYLSEDRERALSRVRGFPATVSNHVKDLLRHHTPAELPADLVEGMAKIQGYDYHRHGHPDAPHTRAVTDQMAERLALIGTAERVAEKIGDLAAAGVTHVCLYLSVVEPEQHVFLLEAYGRLIIPRVRQVAAAGGAPG
ncbi:MAG TPA: TIGR03842 family LLM class F420-dependent oxidoreductase [Methylomirabilota bacterium]|nr:TIGR03842 family LLM class F420-dependent oxidoreductase [Methylomirabilota bacterium]